MWSGHLTQFSLVLYELPFSLYFLDFYRKLWKLWWQRPQWIKFTKNHGGPRSHRKREKGWCDELDLLPFRGKKDTRRVQAVLTCCCLSLPTAGTRPCMSEPSDNFNPTIWAIWAHTEWSTDKLILFKPCTEYKFMRKGNAVKPLSLGMVFMQH